MEGKDKTIIGIVGPTASGKSSLVMEFARRFEFPVEVVSCDSRQIYEGAIIGTASPAEEEKKQIPHHLYNILPPDEKISAGRYAEMAREVFDEIFDREAVPVLVGGTGFYLQALIEGLPDLPEPDMEIRERLRKLKKDWAVDRLHFLLMTVDPVSARRIHPRDTKRVIRALEVYYQTGKPLSSFEPERDDDLNYFIFGLMPEREVLYERINERVLRMVEDGLVGEVEALLERYDETSPVFEGIGYSEMVMHIKGRITLDEAISEIQKNTRHYAKRQLTWFRKVHGIWWLPLPARDFEGEETEMQVRTLIEGLERWG